MHLVDDEDVSNWHPTTEFTDDLFELNEVINLISTRDIEDSIVNYVILVVNDKK